MNPEHNLDALGTRKFACVEQLLGIHPLPHFRYGASSLACCKKAGSKLMGIGG